MEEKELADQYNAHTMQYTFINPGAILPGRPAHTKHYWPKLTERQKELISDYQDKIKASFSFLEENEEKLLQIFKV